jgi:SpoVK/Ycf46/Vps4 family AAA+-type ATPase
MDLILTRNKRKIKVEPDNNPKRTKPNEPKKDEQPRPPQIKINLKPVNPLPPNNPIDPLNHFFNIINNLNNESDDEDYVPPSDDEKEDTSKYPIEYINKKVSTIDDLIELGKMYDPKKKVRYNFDLKRLSNLVEPLSKLKNMIGMELVKKTIVNHVIYYLQDFHTGHDEMMHTVIQGPPGVGKTMLGRILGEIYFGLGVIKGNKSSKRRKGVDKNEKFAFKIVKRSDLIGKYLGHTAAKTQQVIDEAEGGVLFIDEAYSLGNPEQRDSFAKECIDTINQNLSENKGKFLCIIAGYKDALDKCFFSYNEGLRRRFSFVYTVEPYNAKELREIFIKMTKDINWDVGSNIGLDFFEKNYSSFKYYGGDMETLLFNCKLEHSKRVFGTNDEKKKFTREDLDNGFKVFIMNRKDSNNNGNIWKSMYD